MRNKKAQITVFIIVGVVLVISASLIFYLSKPKIEEFKEIAVEELPFELRPVNAFVESCLRDVAEDGIRLIGENGGYTNLTERGIRIDRFSPTDGDGIDLGQGVPYWSYLSSDNDCESGCRFASNAPVLRRTEGRISIEGQLDEYVARKLRECLGNFEAFTTRGMNVTEKGPIDLKTFVLEKEVAFQLKYPLEIKTEATQVLDEFLVKLPVNLKTIYQMALDTALTQESEAYLENYMLNMITAFSESDDPQLPPMTLTEISFTSTKFWLVTDAEDKVESLLSSNIPLLKMLETKGGGTRAGADPTEQHFFNEGTSMYTDASLEGNYSDLAISFTYYDWPIYFNLNCRGFCQAEGVGTSLIRLMGIQRYNTLYDMSFPVLVEIEDDAAFNNKGYLFRFALEGNIRNNQVMTTDNPVLRVSLPREDTMLCEFDQKNSGNITINVTDGLTGEGIEGVSVIYGFQDRETCSNFFPTNASGMVTQRFPVIGFGGQLFLYHQDYPEYFRSYNAQVDVDDKISVIFEPYRTRKLKIFKKRLVKNALGNWVPDFEEDALLSRTREYAIAFLTKTASANSREFYQFVEYREGQDAIITLVPGEYEVDIKVVYEKNINIAPDFRGEAGFVPAETTSLEMHIPGGVKLKHTFTKEDLDRGDTVVLYVIYSDLANVPYRGVGKRVIEDLEEMGKIEDYSVLYASVLEPQII